MRIFSIALILIIPIQLIGQIKGIVKDSDSGEPLPWVVISEKNSKNQVISNDNGEFELTLVDTTIIEIKYTGYINQELDVGKQSYVEITLLADYASITDCYFTYYPRFSKLGISHGLINSMTGLSLISFTPQVFNIGIFINSSFDWRKKSRNHEYIDVSLRRYNFLRLNKTMNVSLKVGYNRIEVPIENKPQRLEKKYIRAELRNRKYTLYSGMIALKNSQAINKQNGLMLGAERLVFGQLLVGGGTEFYQDECHYNLYLKENIERLGMSFEIKYERIPELFEELDFSIYYRLNY